MARAPAPKDNPADEEIRAATKAALERGEDPFGDDEPIEKESIEQRAAKAKAQVDGQDEPGDNDSEQKGEGEAEQPGAETPLADEKPNEAPAAERPAVEQPAAEQAAATESEPEVDDELEPRTYRGMSVDDMRAKREAAEAAIDEAHEKLMDGSMPAKDYRSVEREQRAILDTVLREEARAEARQDQINDYRTDVVQRIAAKARKQGVEYVPDEHLPEPQRKLTPEQNMAAKKNARMFDAAMRTLMESNDDGLSFKQIAAEAHAIVMARNGISRAQAASATPAKPAATPAAPASKPAPRENGKPLTTLRQIPAAATPNTGATLEDSFRGKKGQDFEGSFKKLTPAQKAKLLDE